MMWEEAHGNEGKWYAYLGEFFQMTIRQSFHLNMQHHSQRILIPQYSGAKKNSKNSKGRLW
jgi:hypothetical protein